MELLLGRIAVIHQGSRYRKGNLGSSCSGYFMNFNCTHSRTGQLSKGRFKNADSEDVTGEKTISASIYFDFISINSAVFMRYQTTRLQSW